MRQRAISTSSALSDTSLSSSSSSSAAAIWRNQNSNYDYLAKIILLGPSGSGKSSILHRFIKSECMYDLNFHLFINIYIYI